MKRINGKNVLILLLVIVFCVGLASCGKKESAAPDNAAGSEVTNVPSETTPEADTPAATAVPEPTKAPEVTETPAEEPEPEPTEAPEITEIHNPVYDCLYEAGLLSADEHSVQEMYSVLGARNVGDLYFRIGGVGLFKDASTDVVRDFFDNFGSFRIRLLEETRELPETSVNFVIFSDSLGQEMEIGLTDESIFLYQTNDAETNIYAVLEYRNYSWIRYPESFLDEEDMSLLASNVPYTKWDGENVLNTLTGYLVDIDEDGKDEQLFVGYPMGKYGLYMGDHIYINGELAYCEDYADSPMTDSFFIADIDRSSKGLSILTFEYGPSSDDLTKVYTYSGSGISFAGAYPDRPFVFDRETGEAVGIREDMFDGGGYIFGTKRLWSLQTWFAPAVWSMDGEGKLYEVIPELYYPNFNEEDMDYQLLFTLNLYTDRDTASDTVQITPGRVYFPCTDDKEWLCISTYGRDGENVTGWLSYSSWKDQVVGELPSDPWYAGILFEGLNYAD